MVKFLIVSVVAWFHLLNLVKFKELVGSGLPMDERKVVLTIPVDLPHEMESSVTEIASKVRLARRGGKTEAEIV